MADQETIKYQGKIIEVIEQIVSINGKEKIFEFARRSPGVRLIIMNDNNTLMLTKEFRVEHQNVDYRLPGGKVFDTLEEYNSFLNSGGDMIEAAKKAAIKEAIEEVGIAIDEADITYFATSKCGATVIWDLFYFVVNDYQKLPHQSLEEGEDIEIVELSMEEVKGICLSDKMQEERSAAILLRYLSR